MNGFGKKIVNALRSVIPVAGDSRSEWIRKISFLLALAVFLSATYYVVDEVWLQPHYTQQVHHSLKDLYEKGEQKPQQPDNGDEQPIVFPEGMDPSFEPLYRRNQDVVAWLKFSADQNGTKEDLFADIHNEHNVIIYGHNLNSKQMFSRFNTLVSGNVDRARQLTTLTMETLYGDRVTYKVFAVMVLDADATGTAAFDYIRTEFASDRSKETFLERIKARSLYDYGDVDVLPSDQLLTLSTCSNKRDTTLKNGRTVVVARRVREGEDVTVDPTLTVANTDVLMPKAWYVNKGLALPKEYQ